MAQPSYTVKIIEEHKISPPAASVPTTSLPLTFFDYPWIHCPPMQRVYFFDFPHPTQHFTQTVLPTLTHSLSLTLQYFFPYAASFICPPPPAKPYIHYNAGDSIPLTVAEATGDSNQFITNVPIAAIELHPLVPKPPPSHVENNTGVVPLLALQVTLFPNSCICIGVTFRHIADGRTFHHFMNSWASVCKNNGDLTSIEKSLPSHDRSLVKDTNGLEPLFLEGWWDLGWIWKTDDDNSVSSSAVMSKNNELEPIFLKGWWDLGPMWAEEKSPDLSLIADKVRASFVIGQAQIEKLKLWLKGQLNDNELSLLNVSKSCFVVTCALIWVCMIKSKKNVQGQCSDDDDKLCYLGFIADVRDQINPTVPSTYFGNCLALCHVSLKRGELLGAKGILTAVKAIGNKFKAMESNPLEGAEKWMTNDKEMQESWHNFTIVGLPNLDLYETDFGWGKPKKTELVHIDVSGSVSLVESGKQNGGSEVGFALTKAEIEHFNATLDEILST